MQGEKNMTLLTPAVLHHTALEYLTEQPSDFHRKHVIRFGLMQGLWLAIFFVIFLTATILPGIAQLRETGETVLTHANFTQCSIKNGKLTVDIKPAIWAFTLYDSNTQRKEFVIDSMGTLNRFYWDDRVEKGMVKKVDGVGLTQDHLFIKRGTAIRRVSYSSLFGDTEVKMSKGEIYGRFMEATSRPMVIKLAVLSIPVVFLLGFVLGVFSQIAYVLVMGTMLRLATGNFLRTTSHAYKISNGLYVGYAYVFALAMIAQQILSGTLADLSTFFMVVKAAALLATFAIGFLCLKSLSLRPVASSITKLKRRVT